MSETILGALLIGLALHAWPAAAQEPLSLEGPGSVRVERALVEGLSPEELASMRLRGRVTRRAGGYAFRGELAVRGETIGLRRVAPSTPALGRWLAEQVRARLPREPAGRERSPPLAAAPSDAAPARRETVAPASRAPSGAAPARRETVPLASRAPSGATPARRESVGPASRETAEPGRRTMLVLDVGTGFATRELAFVGDVNQALRAYRLSAAPTLTGRARLYPLALSRGLPVLEGLGVDVEGSWTFAPEARTSASDRYPTRAWAWRAGAVLRIPVDRHAVEVGASFAEDLFVVDATAPRRPDGRGDPELAPLEVQLVRPHVAGEFLPLAWLRFEATFAWRLVFSTGDFASASWFPHQDVTGLDASVSAELDLHSLIAWPVSVVLRGGYQRYFFWMRHEDGDRYEVQGAVDERFTGGLSVRARLGGG